VAAALQQVDRHWHDAPGALLVPLQDGEVDMMMGYCCVELRETADELRETADNNAPKSTLQQHNMGEGQVNPSEWPAAHTHPVDYYQ
jgi:hypothetical protein